MTLLNTHQIVIMGVEDVITNLAVVITLQYVLYQIITLYILNLYNVMSIIS